MFSGLGLNSMWKYSIASHAAMWLLTQGCWGFTVANLVSTLKGMTILGPEGMKENGLEHKGNNEVVCSVVAGLTVLERRCQINCWNDI